MVARVLGTQPDKFFSRFGGYDPPELRHAGRGVPVPDRVDWWIHRVATSGKYASSLIEIQTQWSLDDLLDSIMILDMYDVLADQAQDDGDVEHVDLSEPAEGETHG